MSPVLQKNTPACIRYVLTRGSTDPFAGATNLRGIQDIWKPLPNNALTPYFLWERTGPETFRLYDMKGFILD